jgi:hypothetical protein
MNLTRLIALSPSLAVCPKVVAIDLAPQRPCRGEKSGKTPQNISTIHATAPDRLRRTNWDLLENCEHGLENESRSVYDAI